MLRVTVGLRLPDVPSSSLPSCVALGPDSKFHLSVPSGPFGDLPSRYPLRPDISNA